MRCGGRGSRRSSRRRCSPAWTRPPWCPCSPSGWWTSSCPTASRPTVAAYVLLTLAALARAFGPVLLPGSLVPLAAAGALWVAAFALFLAVYAPILLGPANGRGQLG